MATSAASDGTPPEPGDVDRPARPADDAGPTRLAGVEDAGRVGRGEEPPEAVQLRGRRRAGGPVVAHEDVRGPGSCPGPPCAASSVRLQSAETNTALVPSPERYTRVEIAEVPSSSSARPGHTPGSPVGDTASRYECVPGPSVFSCFQLRMKASSRPLVSCLTIRAEVLTKPDDVARVVELRAAALGVRDRAVEVVGDEAGDPVRRSSGSPGRRRPSCCWCRRR